MEIMTMEVFTKIKSHEMEALDKSFERLLKDTELHPCCDGYFSGFR